MVLDPVHREAGVDFFECSFKLIIAKEPTGLKYFHEISSLSWPLSGGTKQHLTESVSL